MRMTDLKAGWAIVGNDGRRFGTVEAWARTTYSRPNQVFAAICYVPASHIANVEHEVLYLNLAKREADEMGWEQPPRDRDVPDTTSETDLHRHI